MIAVGAFTGFAAGVFVVVLPADDVPFATDVPLGFEEFVLDEDVSLPEPPVVVLLAGAAPVELFVTGAVWLVGDAVLLVLFIAVGALTGFALGALV